MGVWAANTSLGNIAGAVAASACLRLGWGWSFVAPGVALSGAGLVVFSLLVAAPEDVELAGPAGAAGGGGGPAYAAVGTADDGGARGAGPGRAAARAAAAGGGGRGSGAGTGTGDGALQFEVGRPCTYLLCSRSQRAGGTAICTGCAHTFLPSRAFLLTCAALQPSI